jgi:DNA-binding PadR family transcriptional regulator
MNMAPRLTRPTLMVLSAFLQDPTAERYGLDLSLETGLPSGTLYPILVRLEACGWVESRWEDIDPMVERRPRRRYYRLTSDGSGQQSAALALREQATRTPEPLLPGTRFRPALIEAH